MTAKKNKLKLRNLVETYIKDEDISADKNFEEDDLTSSFHYKYTIRDQSYDVYIDTDDENHLLKIFMYSPYKVIKGKHIESTLLLNEINQRINFGRLSSLGESESIQYKNVVPVVEIEPTVSFISQLAWLAGDVFHTWAEELISVTLTKKTAKEILEEVEREVQASNQS